MPVIDFGIEHDPTALSDQGPSDVMRRKNTVIAGRSQRPAVRTCLVEGCGSLHSMCFEGFMTLLG